MSNVRVNIWHCDKDGNYSGYGSETGLTYLRGYQIADENGEVEFITIFPGWYRAEPTTSIFRSMSIPLMRPYHNSPGNRTSRMNYMLSMPISIPQEPTRSPRVQMEFSPTDMLFQTATLTPNTDTGGYDAFLELSVQGSGTATGYLEMEAANVLIWDRIFQPLPMISPAFRSRSYRKQM